MKAAASARLARYSAAPAVFAARPTDIRIVEVRHSFEDFKYRAPYQFGGRTVSDVTLLNVDVRVRTGAGKEAWGFGSMPLGNAWAFPNVPFDASLGAMRALADEMRRIVADCDEQGHPIDLARVLDPEFLRAADAVSRHARAGRAHSQAVHAGRLEPVRRGAARRLRQGVRRQRLRDLHAASS